MSVRRTEACLLTLSSVPILLPLDVHIGTLSISEMSSTNPQATPQPCQLYDMQHFKIKLYNNHFCFTSVLKYDIKITVSTINMSWGNSEGNDAVLAVSGFFFIDLFPGVRKQIYLLRR